MFLIIAYFSVTSLLYLLRFFAVLCIIAYVCINIVIHKSDKISLKV